MAAFISTTDLGDYIGKNLASDNGASFAVDAACDICRDISECAFTAGTTTITLDGSGTDALLLPEHPVSTAGSVTVNGTAETAFQVTPDGLLLRGSAGTLPRPVWPRGRQNIAVTYEHGYATPPQSVRQVALSLAARLIVQGVAQSETVGDVTVAYATPAGELTTNELRILRKYRRPRSY